LKLKAAHCWLLVPALGLLELGGHFWASRRAPSLEEWQALAPAVRSFKKPDELLVVAPEWTDPLARHAFGDALMPIAMLSRADAQGYERAVEVSALGRRTDELRGWRELGRQELGDFTLRRLQNPNYRPVLYRFIDHVKPPALTVSEGDDERKECGFQENAAVVTGGLHGNVAFPRQRFACRGGGGHFVGVTIIDDQEYRPRRCLWAHASLDGGLHLRFAGVKLGQKIRGYGGLSYFLARDGLGTPVELIVRSGERELGRYVHQDEWGWHAFEIGTSSLAGSTQDVELEIRSASPEQRGFCFYAETV
jgi:hypothetical protein